MTKHSSRLISKILYFIISNTSELVLLGLFLGFVLNVDLAIALLVILSSRKCFFNVPSGYCFRFSLSVALLVIVLDFLSQHLSFITAFITAKKYIHLLAAALLNFIINLIIIYS